MGAGVGALVGGERAGALVELAAGTLVAGTDSQAGAGAGALVVGEGAGALVELVAGVVDELRAWMTGEVPAEL